MPTPATSNCANPISLATRSSPVYMPTNLPICQFTKFQPPNLAIYRSTNAPSFTTGIGRTPSTSCRSRAGRCRCGILAFWTSTTRFGRPRACSTCRTWGSSRPAGRRRGVPRLGLHQLHPLVRAGRKLLLVPARPRWQGDRRPAGLPPEPGSLPDRRELVQHGQRLGLAECGQQRRSVAGPGAARPEGAAACRPAATSRIEPAARTCASTWPCKGRPR